MITPYRSATEESPSTLFANTGSLVNVFDGEITNLNVEGDVNIVGGDFMFGTIKNKMLKCVTPKVIYTNRFGKRRERSRPIACY